MSSGSASCSGPRRSGVQIGARAALVSIFAVPDDRFTCLSYYPPLTQCDTMNHEVTTATISRPTEELALGEQLERLTASGSWMLPRGIWALLDPEKPGMMLETHMGPDGPTRLSSHDAGAYLARLGPDKRPLLGRAAIVTAAWLIDRASGSGDRVASFSWAELGAFFGYRQLGSADTDRLRSAITLAAMPAIRAQTVEPAGLNIAVESVVGIFEWQPVLAGHTHTRGGGPRTNRVALHTAMTPLIDAGAWRIASVASLRDVPDRPTAALWFMAPLLTARPAERDGVARVSIPIDTLIDILGRGDQSLPNRARRKMIHAVESLAHLDTRFGSSHIEGDRVVLARKG